MQNLSSKRTYSIFKLNAITRLLGMAGAIPLMLFPYQANAQDCNINEGDNGKIVLSSPDSHACTISDDLAAKLVDKDIAYSEDQSTEDLHITRIGDLAINSVTYPAYTYYAYPMLGKSFNIEGHLTLNKKSRLLNSTIGGNTQINSSLTLINSTLHGDLIIDHKDRESSDGYREDQEGVLSIKFQSAPYTANDKSKITNSIVKGKLVLNSVAIANEEYHKAMPDDAQTATHTLFPYYSALVLGTAANELARSYRTNALQTNAYTRFIVEGKSEINIGDNTATERKVIRSAIAINNGAWGSVLALGEKYDAKKHSVEDYRTKIFFGENSLIKTKADYSHGLVLFSNNLVREEDMPNGTQVYIENKGTIEVAGQASAISADLYRLHTQHCWLWDFCDLAKADEYPITTDTEVINGEKVTVRKVKSGPYWGGVPDTSDLLDNKLQGERSLYILPSLLASKTKLEQGNNFAIVANKINVPMHSILLTEEELPVILEYLTDAKKNFNPNEKVVEIHNSGKLLAPNGYIFSGSEFKDEFDSTAGKLAGKLVLNNGSDKVSLKNTDLSELTELNGAETSGRQKELKKTVKMALNFEYSRLLNDDIYAPDYDIERYFVSVDIPQAINTLNLDKGLTGSSTSSGQANDTKIVNWDIINIGTNAEAKLNLTGNLEDGWDDVLAGSADDFDKNSRKKELNIGHLGTVALVNTQKSASIKYDVTNAGTIDLTSNEITDDVFTIEGNYKGDNGKLLVNSLWHNPDNQENDQLVIKGDASGKTTTVEAKDGIKGNVTLADKEIKNGALASPVVIVEGKDEGRFVGKAMTENAGEAQLVKTVTADGKSQYHWTLGLKNDEQEIINTPSTSYVQSQAVARELGFMTLGRLNHRLGELTNSTEPQTWLRTRIEDDSLNGKNRFAAKSQRYLVQLGQDVALWQNKDKLSRLGVTFSHSKTNTKFFDKYRSENGEVINDKFTTQSKLTALSLGGYFTQRYNNGAYIDFVGQLSHLKFNYLGEAQAKQKGYAIGASVEVGYPIALNSIWDVEPQAQLSYQYIRLSAFSDAQQRQIAKQTSNNLRARLGVRFVANKQFYLAAHLHYAFGNQSKATIGRSNLSEKYAPLTAELSLGGKFDLSPNVSVNLEAHYKKNLSNGYKAVDLQHKGSHELGGQARLQVRF